jgi:hypothetical protein
LTAKHELALDEAAKEISSYSDSIWTIKSIYRLYCPKYILDSASPYINFRDALFHYRKMYKAADEGNEDVIQEQRACIDEHLHRGIKDFIVDICSNGYVAAINEIMNSNPQWMDKNTLKSLRHIYHGLKNIVVEIRLGGITISRLDGNSSFFPSLRAEITSFYTLLNNNSNLNTLFNQTTEKLAVLSPPKPSRRS